MTSEGRKRKRSESPDALLSPARLSPLQPEHPEQSGRAEQSAYTDVDRAATPQSYIDIDPSIVPPATSSVHTPPEPTRTLTGQPHSQRSPLSPAQLSLLHPEHPEHPARIEQPDYIDVDRAATAHDNVEVDLPATSPAISSVHPSARSTLPLIDEPTYPLTEERSAVSPTQLSSTRLEHPDVDLPDTAPTVTSVHTPASSTLPLIGEPTHPLAEERIAVSPTQWSPTQLEYTDVDLPATPPVISPVHTPVRSTFPLTHANLRTIDPTMPNTSEGSTSSAKSVRVTRDHLRTWDHIIEDLNARTEYANFLDEASNLVNGGRRSAMKPASVEKAKKTYDTYKGFNEPTFLDAFWPKLLKEDYTPNDKDRVTVVTAEWLDDHVIGSKDQFFNSACIVASTFATELQKAVRNELGTLPLPKPDILYGLRSEKWCTPDQLAIIKRYERLTMASPQLLLPWFIVEAKGLDGKIEEGINQAARSGAVLNASWHRLDHLAGVPPTTQGPDPRSQVFSLALTPTEARMSLHWAEIDNGDVVAFHTHHLQSYNVYKPEAWIDLRRDVDNVLEWGALKRKKLVSELLDKLVQKGDAAHQQAKRMRKEEERRVTKRRKKSESASAGEGSV